MTSALCGWAMAISFAGHEDGSRNGLPGNLAAPAKDASA
jgi:hypothetical protein